MIPLSLYVHLPWCVSRCPYCDFNAHAAATFDEARYTKAICRELRRHAIRAEGRPLESVFFGGGTPSRFSAEAIGAILNGVQTHFVCAEDMEVTLEANPQSADSARFAGYREMGINRLSIGVQSFEDEALHSLGRAHDCRDADAAVDAAHGAGFANINLDVMFGLPNQMPQQACSDLERAIAHAPEHLSWYQLTLEPGTPFAKRPPPTPDSDILSEMFEQGAALLRRAGYIQYEVSAWSREGFTCRHNRNYWEYGDYLGLGAGAHGKWTDTAGEVSRTVQVRRPEVWMDAVEAGNAIDEWHVCSGPDRVFEFMLGALRLKVGTSWALFEERTGQPRKAAAWALKRARAAGLIVEEEQGLRASDLGWRHLNDLCELFLPSEPPLRERAHSL